MIAGNRASAFIIKFRLKIEVGMGINTLGSVLSMHQLFPAIPQRGSSPYSVHGLVTVVWAGRCIRVRILDLQVYIYVYS